MSSPLDNWYKNQVNNQNIPEYKEEYWQTAQLFIARQKRLQLIKSVGAFMLGAILLLFVGILLLRKDVGSSLLTKQELAYFDILKANSEKDNDKDAVHALPTPENQVGESTKATIANNTVPPIKSIEKAIPNPRDQKNTGFAPVAARYDSDTPQNNQQNANANELENALDINMANTKGAKESAPTDTGINAIATLPSLISSINERPIHIENFVYLAPRLRPEPSFRPSLATGAQVGLTAFADVQPKRMSVLGFDLGLFAQYSMAENWSIESGLSYWHRNGPVGIIKESPTAIYHFEKIDQGYRMEIDELYYLSIPLMINYHINKLTIGAGINSIALINAKAVVSKYRHDWIPGENGFNTNTEIESSQSGYTRDEGLERFNFNVRGALSYRVNRHWELGLQVDYLPQGFTNENFGRQYHQNEEVFRNNYQADRPFLDQALFSTITLRYLW